MGKTKSILILSAALLLGGCLSVVRIPMCHEKVSNEGEVTNRVWSSFCDDVPGMRVYPTVKMRCRVTAEWWKPIPPEAKGKRLREIRMFKHWGWVPLCVIWLTAPFDVAIDTAFLPWDFYVRGKKEEKVRSVTMNEYDDTYSLVWDEEKIRRAAEFYQSLEQRAIENTYADETYELSPYALFPDGGKLIDAFDAKYSCKCSEVVYIDGKPYKVERMKEDEYGYVQPEIKTYGYVK